MGLQMRLVADDPADTEAWMLATSYGFMHPPQVDPDELALRRARQDFARARGVFEDQRCVATCCSFDQRLTAPGGALLAANAVTGVTVHATHRRRGLLTRMLTADLAEAKERGDVVSTLIAAEYAIYGRFGYGPATRGSSWRINAGQAGLDPRWSGPDDGGSLAFVDGAEIRKVGPELHERFRAVRPGAIDRRPLWWEAGTGEVRFGPDPWKEPFFALYRDADGVPQGLLSFTTDKEWAASQPALTAEVRDLFAVTPAAERALWHLLLSVDWVATVVAHGRAPDDLLPQFLPNPRAALVTGLSDFLWMRPLDLPRMLAARAYAASGELVLEVRDPLGLTEGRFLLAASPEGASCAPTTTRGADLTLGTGALAQLFLGDVSAARLAALGALDEETPGAVARADLLLHTGRLPWCPDGF
ncbi:GNAT family N-acetyltransferase [Streptomyces sp. 6N223]|uniref:GNAT family N-acetyltransferase n=1 Tax=Streptomyces sp. 6N223 TaxID=3457412 RepID=UPI003FD55534